MRLFHGLIFFRYFGSLPPPADNRIVRNCDANVPRYIHISAFPNGVRYSVLASLVLTSPVKSDILILVCTTTASSCAVHAHAPRHFRASPSPIGVRCKASPVVRTTDGRLAFSAKNMRLFHGLIFFAREKLLCSKPQIFNETFGEMSVHGVHAREMTALRS